MMRPPRDDVEASARLGGGMNLPTGVDQGPERPHLRRLLLRRSGDPEPQALNPLNLTASRETR